jgi:DNA-binding response OmpR family regulator
MSDKKKKKRTVFMVDDDKFLLDMYTVKFKENDFEVVGVLDSMDALEQLKEGFEPDVVLLDLVMPGMDGFEFLQKVKNEKLAKKAKFIILSNLGQDSDVKAGKQCGADGYIVKASATPSEVVQYVTDILKE